jgi:hypothetical protein
VLFGTGVHTVASSTGRSSVPSNRYGNLKQRRLTDQSVGLIVKRRAREAGLDWRSSAGHGLRAGLAAAAAMADVSVRSRMAQTSHKSLPVVRRYIRDGSSQRGRGHQIVASDADSASLTRRPVR